MNQSLQPTFAGDSRDIVANDPPMRETLVVSEARHTRLAATSLPRQRVHDHATLYLAADALSHWKEVAAATAEQRMRSILEKKYGAVSPPNTTTTTTTTTAATTNEAAPAPRGPSSSSGSHPPPALTQSRLPATLSDDIHFPADQLQQHLRNSSRPSASSSLSPSPTAPPPANPTTSLSIVDASRPSDRVLVINVGGTLGMWPDPKDGRLRPKAGFLLEQMLNLHELRFTEVPVFDFIEYHELVDSSDLNSSTWEILARDIAEHYDDYSGILVAHGTDTLHYTAAALSFALERLAKPVIVMGSMIPLCELYTDTRRNVTAALRFAGCGQWLQPGVYVFFHEQLFYGTRCVKMNDSLKAFESPNSAPAADLNTLRFIRSASAAFLANMMNTDTATSSIASSSGSSGNGSGSGSSRNGSSSGYYRRPNDRGADQVYSDSFYQTLAATSHVTAPLNLRAKFSDRVLCLGIVPDLVMSEASKLFTANNNSKYRNNMTLPRAVVLKVPEMNIRGSVRLAASLQSFGAAAAASGCAVFATSSSSTHGLSPSTIACLLKYVPDVVPLNDMLTECACVKAMWLLGEMLFARSGGNGGGGGGNFTDNQSLENFKRLMFVNLRGEVTATANSIPRPVWISRL